MQLKEKEMRVLQPPTLWKINMASPQQSAPSQCGSILRPVWRNTKRKNLWMRCCFAHLYNLAKIIFCGQAMHLLLEKHRGGLEFHIQGKVFRFTELEFACILGLRFMPAQPPVIEVGARDGSLMQRLFTKIKHITKHNLLTQFQRCKNHNDAVKLALVLFVESFLLGSVTNTSIDTSLLCLVDDFEAFCNCPWGSYAFNFLKQGLEGAHTGRSTRYNIYRCIYAFQIWAYECIPICASLSGKGIVTHIFPGILKWKNMKNLSHRTLVSKVFGKKNMKITTKEKDQQCVKDALALTNAGLLEDDDEDSYKIADEEADEDDREDDVGDGDSEEDNGEEGAKEEDSHDEEEVNVDEEERADEESKDVSSNARSLEKQETEQEQEEQELRTKQVHNRDFLLRVLKQHMNEKVAELEEYLHAWFEEQSSTILQLAEDVRELKENRSKEGEVDKAFHAHNWDYFEKEYVEEEYDKKDRADAKHVGEDHDEEEHVTEEHVGEEHAGEEHVGEDHASEESVADEHVGMELDHVEEEHTDEHGNIELEHVDEEQDIMDDRDNMHIEKKGRIITVSQYLRSPLLDTRKKKQST
ncbi:hypothetical protein HHK36_008099 [Tetracentron sinense]|uniref:DUF1985 domain-containing protein n=1 Tax=Tetracentron sinense TaxID=13715 RepID=A0A834ZEX0_TETSI|nr:hypothetical protein HHK36_008099 [Tetracentron sinense]